MICKAQSFVRAARSLRNFLFPRQFSFTLSRTAFSNTDKNGVFYRKNSKSLIFIADIYLLVYSSFGFIYYYTSLFQASSHLSGITKNLSTPSIYCDWLVDENDVKDKKTLFFNDYYNFNKISEYNIYVKESPAMGIAKQITKSKVTLSFHFTFFTSETLATTRSIS